MTGGFKVMLPAVGIVLFYLVILLSAMILTLHPLHMPTRTIIGGLLSLAGCVAFIPSVTDLAESRGLRTVEVTVYALLATLYTVLAGMAVVYYWKPCVLLYTLLGIAGIATVTVFASELLSRLPN